MGRRRLSIPRPIGPRRAWPVYPILALLFAGCAADRPSDERAEPLHVTGRPLRIVTTVGMITDIVAQVGGQHVSVTGLMGPGVDPHLYKASAGDVERLAGADLVFYGGLHLEARLSDVFHKMRGRVRAVAVTDDIPRERLLAPPQFEGAYDPHVWFDVTLWQLAVGRVRDTLTEADPPHAADYRDRARIYLAELDSLHAYVLAQAARVPERQRVLITAHDAFNYFGRAYGFGVRGLQGISTVTEAGTADVQDLAAFIAERRVPAVFVETSVPRRAIDAVRAAVRARGFEVRVGGALYSDAMGNPGTPAGTYIGMVRHNIDTIVAGLIGSPTGGEE